MFIVFFTFHNVLELRLLCFFNLSCISVSHLERSFYFVAKQVNCLLLLAWCTIRLFSFIHSGKIAKTAGVCCYSWHEMTRKFVVCARMHFHKLRLMMLSDINISYWDVRMSRDQALPEKKFSIIVFCQDFLWHYLGLAISTSFIFLFKNLSSHVSALPVSAV